MPSKNPRRDELKALSATLITAKQMGEIKTINEGLVKLYRSQGHNTLYTFHQWKEQGMSIKSGERALLLWAKPKSKTVEDTDDEFKFFPLCHVFSERQVVKNNK